MPFVPLKLEDLQVGLYIKLECSWWNHPFAKNKFKVSSQQEIATIRGIRKAQLFYDPDLSDPEATPKNQVGQSSQATEKQEQVQPTACTPEIPSPKPPEELREEQIQACKQHSEEIQSADYLYHQLFAQTKIGMKRIGDGHVGGLKSVDQVTQSLKEVVAKKSSSTALIDVLGSTDTEDAFIAHSLNISILSMILGREFGLGEEDMHALGMGVLLHDFGKQNWPSGLRSKRTGLTKMEHHEWLRHPEYGKEAMERFTGFPPSSVEVIYQHHERLNGTGFPLGLKGEEISLLAKIVMVVDEYYHLCHQADLSKSLTPSEALSHLYNNGQVAEKDRLSEEVIIALVRVLGVYPPGSVVKLSDGSLGLVTSVNFEDRTKPQVMVCAPEQPKEEAMVVDLAQEVITIVQSLHSRDLPKEIQEYFFATRLAS